MYRTAEALYQGYYDRHGVLVRDRRSWMVSRFVEQLLRGEPVTRAQWDRYGAAGGRPEFLFETVKKLAASHRAPPAGVLHDGANVALGRPVARHGAQVGIGAAIE